MRGDGANGCQGLPLAEVALHFEPLLPFLLDKKQVYCQVLEVPCEDSCSRRELSITTATLLWKACTFASRTQRRTAGSNHKLEVQSSYNTLIERKGRAFTSGPLDADLPRPDLYVHSFGNGQLPRSYDLLHGGELPSPCRCILPNIRAAAQLER